MTPDIEVSMDGNEFRFKTTTHLKSREQKFKLGVEYEEKTFDGRNVRCSVMKDGNKFIFMKKGSSS